MLKPIYSLVRVNWRQFHVSCLDFEVPETPSSPNVLAVVRICGRRHDQARRYIPSESIESQRSQSSQAKLSQFRRTNIFDHRG